MNLIYLIPGFLFLFIPSLSIVDIMPDFIGYALVLAGISKLADMDYKVGASRDIFVKLFYINLIKNFVAMACIKLNDEITTMTFTFLFAIIECVMLYIAFNSLLDGVYYIASRSDVSTVERDFKSVRLMCNIFVIVRSALCVIPQLVSLTNEKYQAEIDISAKFTMYNYKQLILIACLALSLVIGIMWLFYMIKYFTNIRKNKNLIAELGKRYESEILSNENIFIKRKFKTAITLISVGFVFFDSFYFEGIDIIPSAVGIAFILVALSFMKKYIKVDKVCVAVGIVAFALSIFDYGYKLYISLSYYRSSYVLKGDAFYGYKNSANISLISNVISLTFILLLIKALFNVVNQHTGSKTQNEDAIQNKYNYEIKKKLSIKLKCFSVLTVIAFGLNSACAYLYIQKESWWLVSAAVMLLWAFSGFRTLFGLLDKVQDKYI